MDGGVSTAAPGGVASPGAQTLPLPIVGSVSMDGMDSEPKDTAYVVRDLSKRSADASSAPLAMRAAQTGDAALAQLGATVCQQAGQEALSNIFKGEQYVGVAPQLSVRCIAHRVAPVPGDASVHSAGVGFSVLMGVKVARRKLPGLGAPEVPAFPAAPQPRFDPAGNLLNPQDMATGLAMEAERARLEAEYARQFTLTPSDSSNCFLAAAGAADAMAQTVESTFLRGAFDGLAPSVSTSIKGWYVAPNFGDPSKPTAGSGFTILFTVRLTRPVETPSASAKSLSDTAYFAAGGLPLAHKAARLGTQTDVDGSPFDLPEFGAPNAFVKPKFEGFDSAAQAPSPAAAAAAASAAADASMDSYDSEL